MKEVCKERYLMGKKKGYPFPICKGCVFDKNLDGYWGDCDFVFEKSNHMLPIELKDDTIDLLLNSSTNIERINYLKELNRSE
ncbi:hypothetical protein HN02_03 [Clostridium phage vB_CpeP_HN02]|uniref:Uncharacterized protein n=1 Tax=Clostridium phage vB_CpeP_HN02 TaxID=2834252 RepID=A0A8E6GSI7_9CAUD|nr:hypothetical protein HN02_03 [Clostridium phage vB_CpeP_HN02]